MPSTRLIISWRYSASAVVGRRGASVKPQLPAMTVVTPWLADGDAPGSHRSWAS